MNEDVEIATGYAETKVVERKAPTQNSNEEFAIIRNLGGYKHLKPAKFANTGRICMVDDNGERVLISKKLETFEDVSTESKKGNLAYSLVSFVSEGKRVESPMLHKVGIVLSTDNIDW